MCLSFRSAAAPKWFHLPARLQLSVERGFDVITTEDQSPLRILGGFSNCASLPTDLQLSCEFRSALTIGRGSGFSYWKQCYLIETIFYMTHSVGTFEHCLSRSGAKDLAPVILRPFLVHFWRWCKNESASKEKGTLSFYLLQPNKIVTILYHCTLNLLWKVRMCLLHKSTSRIKQ